MKVLICIPSGDDWKADFAISLTALQFDLHQHGIAARPANYRSSILPHSRQILVQSAIEYGAEYVLFLDSDMAFPAWVARRLLSLNLGIVAANCARKDSIEKATPTAARGWNFDKEINEPLETMRGNAPIEVDAVGLGCMLIRTDVFKKLREPWFLFQWHEGKRTYIGEDYYFCAKAKRAGYSIHVDPIVSRYMGHVGTHAFNLHFPQLDKHAFEHIRKGSVHWEEMIRIERGGEGLAPRPTERITLDHGVVVAREEIKEPIEQESQPGARRIA